MTAPLPPCAVFCHNVPVFSVWQNVWHQWRWLSGGMGAPVRAGLDWCQVEAVMRMRGIRKAERGEIMQGLRVMESTALQLLAEQAENERLKTGRKNHGGRQ